MPYLDKRCLYCNERLTASQHADEAVCVERDAAKKYCNKKHEQLHLGDQAGARAAMKKFTGT